MEPLPRAYKRFWIALALTAAAGLWWTQTGRAWNRRRFHPPQPQSGPATDAHFVAVLFPRISDGPEDYALAKADFATVLSGLKALGYSFVSADDVLAFYRGRPLPRRSVLIALDRDEPQSVTRADAVIDALRLRAAVFLGGAQAMEGASRRYWLSPHAVSQLLKSGAWDVGEATGVPGEPGRRFVLRGRGGELAFLAGLTGYNDRAQGPGALRLLAIRPRDSAAEDIRLIHGCQPRRFEFVDDFRRRRLDRDWALKWGAASTARGRLNLLPLPGRTGAALALRGTEGWADAAVELVVDDYKEGFWAYARYRDPLRFVRVGIVDGQWLLQQRTPALPGPALLGRARVEPGGLPAKVRLVVKGDSAMLFIGGVMQFGKAARLDPEVDRGPVELGVYGPRVKSAYARVHSVRAAPLGRKWLSVDGRGLSLDRLRTGAVEAAALSPRWLTVDERGVVAQVDGEDQELLRAFAGFYRCRLVPEADLAAWRARGPASAARLSAELAVRTAKFGEGALNARLPSALERAAPLAEALRAEFHRRGLALFLTVDGTPLPEWSTAAGVLRAAGPADGGVQPLERLRWEVSRWR